MLFILIIYVLLLIRLSIGDQCPSSDYCTCSSDLTIIKCTDHQLTNEILFNINNQLPESTILLNLSSNSLTTIEFLSNLNHLQILDLSYNKIHYIPTDFLSKFPHLTTLYLQNNSLKTIPKTFKKYTNINIDLLNNPFYCTCQSKWFQTHNQLKNIICQNNKPFDENDFCRIKNFLEIYPQQAQMIYENEPFILNCSSNSKHYWTLNDKIYPSTIASSLYSAIIIDHLQIKHSGIWTCHNFNSNRSISLTVLQTSSNHFCPSIRMNTSKGYFHWPRTLINNKIEKKCPFGSAAWLRNSNEYARAWYMCSSSGDWMNLDVSQCAFQSNISRIFDRLSLTETNLLLRIIKYLSKIDKNNLELFDIILLIDLIDEQQVKYKNQDRIMLIYHLTDFILQIKHNFMHFREYRMALTRLRLIIERLLDFTDQPWLYIGKELTAMTMQAPLSLTSCVIPDRSLLTIICEPDDHHQHQSPLMTIQFPSSLNKTNQNSFYYIIFYRQSTLFASDNMQNNDLNPAIYIRPVSRYSSYPIKLTFYGQANQASIGIWYLNQTSWQIKSSICKINEQNNNLISTDCVLFNNNSLSLTYLDDINNQKNLFFNTKYSQLTIYVSSILATICFFISIIFYICFYKIYQIPRRFFHCLINYWLNLGILISLFAFGIQQNQHPFLCEFISICLHFLCLTTILWLTLLSFSIWRKLYLISTDKDYHEKSAVMMVDYDDVSLPIMKLKSKPVIQFYLIAYGLAFIICGANVITSREPHLTNKICFSNHFDSMLLLIIPIFMFIFLSLIFLLISRNYIKQITKKKIHLPNLSDESGINSEHILLSKRNKILPLIIPSNQNNQQIISNIKHYNSHSDNIYSTNIDYRYESINQLLSILCQLILLIFLFLSSLAIYLQPLQTFKLRFENVIYSHLYGFFVLFLAFYILSYHVLSRSNLITRFYTHRNNDDNLINRFYIKPPPSSSINTMIIKDFDTPSSTDGLSLSPPSHTCSLTNRDVCQVQQHTERTTINNNDTYDSKPLMKIKSEHYAFYRHIPKTNATSSSKKLPLFPALDVIVHENINKYQSQRNSLNERSLKKSTYSPVESLTTETRTTQLSSSSFPSCQSFTYPRISPSQAIIRPLPITRLHTLSTSKNLSKSSNITQSNSILNPSYEQNTINTTSQNSTHIMSSISHEEEEHHNAYVSLNKLDHFIQQESANEKLLIQRNSPYEYVQVGYIDDVDDGSVSLKISRCDSNGSLNTISTVKDDTQTLLSLSSTNSENDFNIDINQIKLHESTV
ncbi:unnamed protein product [Adineta steineri]|uniref:Uncharacterized protein n=1 Tax=Adineta steineri TaxID=433720 RepID=A0A813VS06_9BILA|nr:unnamed protein product [Adineta steineri]